MSTAKLSENQMFAGANILQHGVDRVGWPTHIVNSHLILAFASTCYLFQRPEEIFPQSKPDSVGYSVRAASCYASWLGPRTGPATPAANAQWDPLLTYLRTLSRRRADRAGVPIRMATFFANVKHFAIEVFQPKQSWCPVRIGAARARLGCRGLT